MSAKSDFSALHPCDSRIKIADKAQTLTSRMGTGGNNVPLIMNEVIPINDKATRCKGGGGTRNNDGAGNGLGIGNASDPMYTITSGDKHAVATFEPKMWSYTDGNIASTMIATQHKDPQCVCIQGSVIGREEKNGPKGSGINEDVAFTLNTTDKHCVFYEADLHNYKEGNCGTLKRSGGCIGGGSESLITEVPLYTVRRLIPSEYALLQGFDKDWCSDLGTENPTEDEIVMWAEIFETHRKVVSGAKKPKSRTQIIKWLKNPYSESAEYKLWGNGVALPCVNFVMAGIVKVCV